MKRLALLRFMAVALAMCIVVFCVIAACGCSSDFKWDDSASSGPTIEGGFGIGLKERILGGDANPCDEEPEPPE